MAKTRRRHYEPVPLPADFWTTLVALARRCGLSPVGGAPLQTAVRVASQLYTGQRQDIPGQAADPDMLAARLLFYLVRDFSKVVAPLEELRRLGRAPGDPDAPLRVLDLGAGIGASTLGVARYRALAAGERAARVEVTALDTEAAALEVAKAALATVCDGRWAASVSLRTEVGSAARVSAASHGKFDLVIGSFVLNEMLLSEPEATRAHAGAAILRRWADCVADGGALLVLEPALKTESRVLSAVRDVLVAQDQDALDALQLVAPCLHRSACPMLEGERDWCHQDLPLALPPPFDAIARGAGLRWEGLSFSYLSFVRGGASAPGAAEDERLLRVVSDAMLSKGKRELLGCGDGELVRLTRLDRSESDDNEAFGELSRGHVFALEGAVEKGRGLRVDADTRVSPVAERGL